MNASMVRMAKKFGVSLIVAEKLVAAGYDTPREVRDAKDADLLKAVAGEDLVALRRRWKAKA